MASENKYSFEMVARSGDRVLTQVVYPGQNYADLVTIQAFIALALTKAGFDQAVLKGDEIPPQLADMLGVQSKGGQGKPGK